MPSILYFSCLEAESAHTSQNFATTSISADSLLPLPTRPRTTGRCKSLFLVCSHHCGASSLVQCCPRRLPFNAPSGDKLMVRGQEWRVDVTKLSIQNVVRPSVIVEGQHVKRDEHEHSDLSVFPNSCHRSLMIQRQAVHNSFPTSKDCTRGFSNWRRTFQSLLPSVCHTAPYHRLTTGFAAKWWTQVPPPRQPPTGSPHL
jgi:hypothetical protein